MSKLAFLLGLLVYAGTTLADDTDVSVVALPDVPQYASDNSLQLTLTTSGETNPLQYAVIPLTSNLGMNESQTATKSIKIIGNLIAADADNYNQIKSPQDIAYLSCDKTDGFMTSERILRKLMAVEPKPIKAILLYTMSGNWCDLRYLNELPYTSILSMADAAEAGKALSFLNDTDNGEIVKARITGDISNDPDSDGSGDDTDSGPKHSGVAMSVLYCITGVITTLFLLIIITGAVRAHRYPERYGPRGGQGGRSRQSRAKGLARAVLDTIPIVKFGNPPNPKSEQDIELDGTSAESHDVTSQRIVPNSNESNPPSDFAAAAISESQNAKNNSGASSTEPSTAAINPGDTAQQLGCSICTEDFQVGEDVRVLPCNHQFHPTCVDPWLVKVSGTCPLCRLNLHPRRGSTMTSARSSVGSAAGRLETDHALEESLPPPLALDEEQDAANASQRRGVSRLFDINRLRLATDEERLATLRQMGVEQRTNQDADAEDRRQGARLAERLKERFRIRTRAQSPQRSDGDRS